MGSTSRALRDLSVNERENIRPTNKVGVKFSNVAQGNESAPTAVPVGRASCQVECKTVNVAQQRGYHAGKENRESKQQKEGSAAVPAGTDSWQVERNAYEHGALPEKDQGSEQQKEGVSNSAWIILNKTMLSNLQDSGQMITSSNIRRSERVSNLLTSEGTKPEPNPRQYKVEPRYTVYHADVYNSMHLEYLEEYIHYVHNQENIIATSVSLYSDKDDRIIRAYVLNWLLGLQDSFLFTDSEYYFSIRLYDQALSKGKVDRDMDYHLVILCTTWMACKVIGDVAPDARDVMQFCPDIKYTTKHLRKVERRILKIMDWTLSPIEPTISLSYFLYKLNLYQHKELSGLLSFLLDVAVLIPEYSCIPHRILAAALIEVATKRLSLTMELHAVTYFNRFFNTEETAVINGLRKSIEKMESLIMDKGFQFREAYIKHYLT